MIVEIHHLRKFHVSKWNPTVLEVKKYNRMPELETYIILYSYRYNLIYLHLLLFITRLYNNSLLFSF